MTQDAYPELTLPPFLVVTKADAERRRLAWEANPPKPMPSFSGPRSDSEAERVAAFQAAEAVRAEKHAADLKALRLRKKAEALGVKPGAPALVMVGGRYQVDLRPNAAIEAAIAAAPPEAVEAFRNAENARSRTRRLKAKIGQDKPAKAKTAPVTKAAKPAPVANPNAIKGNEADDTTERMLRAPAGVTQEELAAALGCTGDAARGRISKVVRARKLTVSRPVVDGRKAYKVD